MYGGGFATVPAYLADLFGTRMVGAIHGRLLTAWSAAGIFGPVIVNYIREYQLNHGVAHAQVCTINHVHPRRDPRDRAHLQYPRAARGPEALHDTGTASRAGRRER
jgi:hypothetical protein